MTNARIFLAAEEGKWIPMEESPYDQEIILQAALADYPDLLPGDQIDPEDPPRWLLVKREMGVPAEEGGGSVGSLDHLYLDHRGKPTFVECKRAADTRSRREVVAQMLDYAANGTEYWPMEKLRQAAAETASETATGPESTLDEQIRELVGDDDFDIESYWELVETNLRQGNIRLLFVADSIPKELRRLVEFLNSKMNDVEVLAVEVKQYLGHGQKVMVPRVIGLTEEARSVKRRSTPKSKTTREIFLNNCTEVAAAFFADMLDRSVERGHTIYWGEKGFSVRVYLPDEDRLASFGYGFPEDRFIFRFPQLPLSQTQIDEVRKKLEQFGVLEPEGNRGLKCAVTEETKQKLVDVYSFILNEVDVIADSD